MRSTAVSCASVRYGSPGTSATGSGTFASFGPRFSAMMRASRPSSRLLVRRDRLGLLRLGKGKGAKAGERLGASLQQPVAQLERGNAVLAVVLRDRLED